MLSTILLPLALLRLTSTQLRMLHLPQYQQQLQRHVSAGFRSNIHTSSGNHHFSCTMAPTQSRKRKSDQMASTPEAVTPTGSPQAKKMKITQIQKQALIDNLQLEITQRARHLRAHYALQCADLRSRIERRINRVPIATRKMTMGELMAKHQQSSKPTALPSIHEQTTMPVSKPEERQPAVVVQTQSSKPVAAVHSQPSRPVNTRKRKSSDIHILTDKEDSESNSAPPQTETLPVQKNTKRAKTATTTAKSTKQRATSRNNKGGVLSPRSHNSRTLPRSPIKESTFQPPQSPSKTQTSQPIPQPSYIARPASPLKPNSPFKSAASAVSASVHGMLTSAKQRGVAAGAKLSRTASREKTNTVNPSNPKVANVADTTTTRSASQASNHTVTSEAESTITNGTVVTKPKRGRPATTKTATAAGKKAAAATTTIKSTTTTKNNGVSKTTTTVKRTGTAATRVKASAAPATTTTANVTAEPVEGTRRTLRKRY